MNDTIKTVMTHDHRKCDDLFVQLDSLVMNQEWKQARLMALTVMEDINYHLSYEEDLLFPEFEKLTQNTTGPTMMMRQEHESIRELLNDLNQAVNDSNLERYAGLSETLHIFIQQHNMKEEGILYPMIDDACGPNKNRLTQGLLQHRQVKVA